MKKHSLFGLMLVFIMLGMNVANAATFGSVTPMFDTVANSSRDGDPGVQNDSEQELNDGAFFGLNNWQEIVKIDTNDTDNSYNDGVLTISNGVRDDDNDLVSGDWSLLSSVWDEFDSITIVLKDGNVGDIFWTAWLLEEGATFGHWAMPERNLSHMTVYGSTSVVPVPAAVWLFGSGLAGLIGAARRKSTAVQA